MAKTAPAAGNDAETSRRPARIQKPTATLLEHSEGAALPSQQKKIDEYRAAKAAKQYDSTTNTTVPSRSTATTPTISNAPSPSPSLEFPDSPENVKRPSFGKRKSIVSDVDESDDEGDGSTNGVSSGLPGELGMTSRHWMQLIHNWTAKRPRFETDIVDSEGLLEDVDVQSTKVIGSSCEDKSRDIDEFFAAPVDRIGTNGATKKHRLCKLCP